MRPPAHMLNSDEICANKRDVIDLPESADDTRMVNSRNKNGQKVSQESRLFLQIECQSFVINFNVGCSHNHILELVVFPGVRRTLYHHQGRVIKLVILASSGQRCARSVALITFGILIWATKSLRCSINFPGRYLLYKIDSSVKTPI